MALVLVYLVAAAGILYFGRGLVGRIIRWAHEPGADHGHAHGGLKTEGMTLKWATLYDYFLSFLLRGQERKLREATLDSPVFNPAKRCLT